MSFGFTTRTVIHDKALRQWAQSARGPLARHIRVKAAEVQLVARGLVGVRTGRLRTSIKIKRDFTITQEYAVLVGSKIHYARLHHTGTRPHTIPKPVRPGGKRLAFQGRDGRIYRRYVNHPGTSPNPYLTAALRAVF